jgi:hypothetical protein
MKLESRAKDKRSSLLRQFKGYITIKRSEQKHSILAEKFHRHHEYAGQLSCSVRSSSALTI